MIEQQPCHWLLICGYRSLVTFGKLQAGRQVLTVSVTRPPAILMVKAIGAHVIATSSSLNATFVKPLGTDEGIARDAPPIPPSPARVVNVFLIGLFLGSLLALA